MCSIAGLISSKKTFDEIKSSLSLMLEKMIHRGPDDSGIWQQSAQRFSVGLGHQRLSILDLSTAGSQPMISPTQRYILTYNGEIYNYHEIRKKLSLEKQIKFKSNTDTEVLLNAIEYWGIKKTLNKLNGMFAFAIYDTNLQEVTLVRDRVGIKPLYYAHDAQELYFSSEIKAIRAANNNLTLDESAISAFLRYAYIPDPYCIYSQVKKLNPGHYITFKIGNDSIAEKSNKCYWSIENAVQEGMHNPLVCSDKDIIDQLNELLIDAVKKRMISDVPIGTFLSGGVDSSTIVALTQQLSIQPIKTFSIGSNGWGGNEAPYAKAIAKHLNTQHTEYYVSAADVLKQIPNISNCYDEPYADPSQFPTYLVSEIAKKQVTVSLSGDGGDELFGGYNRYIFANSIWRKIQFLPYHVRRTIGFLLYKPTVKAWEQVFRVFNGIIPKHLQQENVGNKLHKLARALGAKTPYMLYQSLVSTWQDPEAILHSRKKAPEVKLNHQLFPNQKPLTAMMMYIDFVTYLVGDILTKVDRASMAVSLEARVPFLDHRVIEFAWRIPVERKFNNGISKYYLRNVLYKYAPKKLFERPKMGFGIPIAQWLRGPLRDWAEGLLLSCKKNQLFDHKIIEQKWKQHLTGSRDWSTQLWSILMFQNWYETYFC